MLQVWSSEVLREQFLALPLPAVRCLLASEATSVAAENTALVALAGWVEEGTAGRAATPAQRKELLSMVGCAAAWCCRVVVLWCWWAGLFNTCHASFGVSGLVKRAAPVAAEHCTGGVGWLGRRRDGGACSDTSTAQGAAQYGVYQRQSFAAVCCCVWLFGVTVGG
jgi:hypothetical protein